MKQKKEYSKNPYGFFKAVISTGMTVKNWWEKGYDRTELLKAFGFNPLRNGIIEAKHTGEDIPDQVFIDFPEFIDLK